MARMAQHLSWLMCVVLVHSTQINASSGSIDPESVVYKSSPESNPTENSPYVGRQNIPPLAPDGVASARSTHSAAPAPALYYIEKGIHGEPSMSKLMHPLRMHKDPTKKNSENADRKYFVRISTSSEKSEHCWIKVMDHSTIPPVQYWSTPESNLIRLLGEFQHFTVNLETSPSKPFVLPSNTKWEIIVDPETRKMELNKLEHFDNDMDAVQQGESGDSGITGNNPLNPVHEPYGTNGGDDNTDNIAFGVTKKKSLKIATGSCLQQRFKRLQAFKAMELDEPDIIVLSGDNVYLDMIPRQYGCLPCFNNDVVDNDKCPNWCFNWFWETVDLNASAEYQRLLRHSDFPRNTAKWHPVWLATWDDHDYGRDNSNAANARKVFNKKAFMEFYMALNHGQTWIQNHAAIDAMRIDPRRGIYHHYHHREITVQGEVEADFIMLDVRYHRTEGDILGAAQWTWLQQTFDRINTELQSNWIVIVLGTTYLLEHSAIADKVGGESWDKESRSRLMSLIEKLVLPLERILLISGDVHFSVVHDFQKMKEFTVSSFTHSLGPIQKCCGTKANEYAVTPITCVNGYGLLELTPNSWEFVLKDGNRARYMPLNAAVPQVVYMT